MTKHKSLIATITLPEYLERHDGVGAPRLDFQEMYQMFANLEFHRAGDFGGYANYGMAFEYKRYDMMVCDIKTTHTIGYIRYREYQDANEQSAYFEEYTEEN